MPQYDTLDVFAVVCAIYRANGNQIVKDNDKNIPTNKKLVLDHFADLHIVDVTDVDREQAVLCLSQLKNRVLINQLTDRKQNDFINGVCELATKNKIGANKFGIAVWIPKVIAGMKAEEQQQLDVAHIAFTSYYQGRIGEKITLEFHPIRVKFMHEYNCFRHFGHDGNGNLIGFLNKKELSGIINGKVKKHDISKFNNNGKVTYLNYVKGSV
jgi:hypothetical protein